MKAAKQLLVLLPDTRGVELSPYTLGNAKIGFGVYTYSRRAGAEVGTCPGATAECEEICYAKRIRGVLRDQVYARNSITSDVPPIPDECKILRIHVSGDFDTNAYIENWIARLTERPDVTCWAYTRSWRVPTLLASLERLRALPNMQLFASMDPTCRDLPPDGWRRAWIQRDFDLENPGRFPPEDRIEAMTRVAEPVGSSAIIHISPENWRTFDGGVSYTCPEETGTKKNCLECGYCFEGQKNDVTFIEHTGPAK